MNASPATCSSPLRCVCKKKYWNGLLHIYFSWLSGFAWYWRCDIPGAWGPKESVWGADALPPLRLCKARQDAFPRWLWKWRTAYWMLRTCCTFFAAACQSADNTIIIAECRTPDDEKQSILREGDWIESQVWIDSQAEGWIDLSVEFRRDNEDLFCEGLQ